MIFHLGNEVHIKESLLSNVSDAEEKIWLYELYSQIVTNII